MKKASFEKTKLSEGAKSLLFILLFWCPGMAGVAQERSFSHLSVEDGMSQSSVISILQDSKGFMWFGTRSCLNRYDTRSFRVYRHSVQDTNSISSNDYIFALLRDRRDRLWVGTQRGLNLYLPGKDAFQRVLHDTLKDNSIDNNYINCLYEDDAGRIWVGTNSGLNLLTGTNPCRFAHFLIKDEVHAICADPHGMVWVGTNKGLIRIASGGEGYTFLHDPADPRSLSSNSVTSIVTDRKGDLWVATENGGLELMDRDHPGKFTHFRHDGKRRDGISSDNIRKIIVDSADNLWIGTNDGLNYFNTATGIFTVYRNDPGNPYSLSNNSIRDLYVDKDGSLWVGTVFGGVNVTQGIATPFKVYKTSNFVNSISSNVVSAITADEKHNLWIGTEAEGLNYYDRGRDLFVHYKHDPSNPASLSGNFIKSIYKDSKDRIWVGTYDGGLNLLRPATGTFVHYQHDAAKAGSLPGDNISCIQEDSQGRFWIGAYGKGLNLFDRLTGTCQTFTADPGSAYRISSNWVRGVFEDSRQNLWVGTAHGLNLLPAHKDRFTWFLKGGRDSLLSDYINCIMEDRKGRVWVGTYDGGIAVYHPETGKFSNWTMQDGLPGNNVRGILEDEHGALWLSTDNGLCKFDVALGKAVTTYNIFDGLPGNEFNYNSYYKDADGRLFLGGFAGMVSFYPNEVRVNTIVPPVVFTALKLFNRPVGIRDGSGLLDSSVSLTHSIKFSASQNIFTIEFAALNFIKPGKNQYGYKLDGFEKDWNFVSNPAATYTNLPAGHYTFLARGSNNDGVWNPEAARMEIIVLPPVWETWWAYLIYVLVGGILLWLVIRFFRRQARLERDLYYEHQQIDFFTNISHEIRTPLTLIIGPIEKLLRDAEIDGAMRRQLGLAQKNAVRLMSLMTELLDFKKIESGKMKLRVAQGDIVAFTRGIFCSFEDMAAGRRIGYDLITNADELLVWYDSVQLEKVLFNLLSNAFKFTEEGGKVEIRLLPSDGQVRIEVLNTGREILPQDRSKLFERFYQAGPTVFGGTGIGLALSKSIVELHHGRIGVESGKGITIFRIELALGNRHFSEAEMASGGMSAVEVREADWDQGAMTETVEHKQGIKPTVLLVEDNPEIRLMIKEALTAVYHIEESSNGSEAWDAAVRIIPDLVISDVMMEGADDGFRLCQRLKQDERTSHIPVILLTARVGTVDQVSGLKTGADVYITKPFHIQVLELQVKNLLALRDLIRRRLARTIMLPTGSEEGSSVVDDVELPLQLSPDETIAPALSSVEELFLEKVVGLVEQHMEDPDFGVAVLLRGVGMSQSVLYRKLKALTDMSILDFIKSVRLKKAAELLRSGEDLTVADVAYRVGFSDRKYFSREFRKQFGVSPSEYLEGLGGNLSGNMGDLDAETEKD